MKSIILFDGICNFCNSSVQFIIKRDRNELFQFASLQSDIGKQLLADHNIPHTTDSLVLIEGDRAHAKSGAALRIAKNLNGLWRLTYFFIIIPPFIRNALYDFFAANRYKWFGKKDACPIPTKETKKRFL